MRGTFCLQNAYKFQGGEMAKPDVKALKQARDKGLAWARSGASADGVSPLQLESSRTARKRCKGVTKSGEPCTAWAMEGGLCYFHANPDKAAELGRNGGRRRKHTYEQATEQIAPPESAADVRRMLAETMADVKAGKMFLKVGGRQFVDLRQGEVCLKSPRANDRLIKIIQTRIGG
jgi:hypothetical protein